MRNFASKAPSKGVPYSRNYHHLTRLGSVHLGVRANEEVVIVLHLWDQHRRSLLCLLVRKEVMGRSAHHVCRITVCRITVGRVPISFLFYLAQLTIFIHGYEARVSEGGLPS